MKLPAHRIYLEDESGKETKATLAIVHPASNASVELVLSADEDSPDGRSNWLWVRLSNGDLILGVFPQGDTYFGLEDDAHAPSDI